MAEQKRGRPTLSNSVKKKRKRERAKMKVYLGQHIADWNCLKEGMGFSHDFEVARYMLEFEKAGVKPQALVTEAKPSTSTPMRIHVLTSGPKPASPQMSSISERGSSSAAEQEIDVTGVTTMSGVEEVRSTTSEEDDIPVEDIPPILSSRRRKVEEKKLSKSFLDPFELTLDCTCEAQEEEVDEDDDDDDPLYEPSFVIEQILPKEVQDYEDVAYEEAEFGLEREEDQASEEEESDREETNIDEDTCGGLAGEVKVLVFVKQLLTLAEMMVEKCKTCSSERIVIKETYVGSCVSLKWVCQSGHIAAEWRSQPVLNRRMNSGDFLICATILTSGNNFGKLSLWAQMLQLKFPSASQFTRIQTHYLVPSIDSYWERHQEEVLSTCEGDVVVLGDGRNDSPGHCAQYCSYSLMDNASKQILTIQTIDKRMTGRKSAAMEKLGFQAAMNELKSKEVTVKEVVTDAHLGIGALMKTPDYDKIQHSHDIWHAAKNLGKKITKVAMKKGNRALGPWIKDIVNHFWFTCKQAETKQQFLAIWVGVMHHIVNEHAWIVGHGDPDYNHCLHEPLEGEDRDKSWLHPVHDASALKDLAKIVFDKRLFNLIDKYLNFRSTADLEGFHQHILMYAAKRYAYTPPVYRVRNYLAAIDHNKHVDRPKAVKKDGTVRLHRTWNKKSGRWTVYEEKEKKTFSYIPELLTSALLLRLNDKIGMSRKKDIEEKDPRRISRHLAPEAPLPTEELIAQKQSRFK